MNAVGVKSFVSWGQMRSWRGDLDLAALALACLLALPFIYGGAPEPFRALVATPLVLLYPGYALAAALLPLGRPLDTVERLALAIGLSLALVPIFGLVLHFTPWGISLTSMVVVLTLWTLALSGIARLRRLKAPRDVGTRVHPRSSLRLEPLNMAVRTALILALLGALGFTAWQVYDTEPLDSATELYVLGAGGLLGDYPTTLWVGRGQSLKVGVANREEGPMAYTVRAVLGGVSAGVVAVPIMDPGESWEGRLRVEPQVEGLGQRLELWLFSTSEDQALDKVHIFVDVLSPPLAGG
jgi:uncharacterized membrane protein